MIRTQFTRHVEPIKQLQMTADFLGVYECVLNKDAACQVSQDSDEDFVVERRNRWHNRTNRKLNLRI
jgi:hypothetical protein